MGIATSLPGAAACVLGERSRARAQLGELAYAVLLLRTATAAPLLSTFRRRGP